MSNADYALCFIFWLIGWFVVGAFVLAMVDDDDLSLLGWAMKCPIGSWAVIAVWPIVAVCWLRRDRG